MNQKELKISEDSQKEITKTRENEDIISKGEEIIEKTKNKIKEKKIENKKDFNNLVLNLEKFLISLKPFKESETSDQEKKELNEFIKKIEEIESEINLLLEELDLKVERLEIESRLNHRESSTEEKGRLENLKEEHPAQMEALKKCSKIFNDNCSFPWYVTGSIAFLINAENSTKQPEDIDIIFHEKDFEKMKTKFEFELLEFKSGIAESTGCPFIMGKIEIIDEKTGKKREIEMEAFGQKIDEKNGLINPGAKNTEYNIIKNKVSEEENENFNILDKNGQTELYFKSLASEIRGFSFEEMLKKKNLNNEEYKDKSIKFINRFANLLELNNNDYMAMVKDLRNFRETDDDKLLHMQIINAISEFRKKELKISDKNLDRFSSSGDLQADSEKIKTEILPIQSEMINIYNKILEYYKKDEGNLESLIENSEKEVMEKFEQFINSCQQKGKTNQNDLLPYFFIKKFVEDFLNPFKRKMDQAKKTKYKAA